MFLPVALLLFGALLLYGAYQNQSFQDMLEGKGKSPDHQGVTPDLAELVSPSGAAAADPSTPGAGQLPIVGGFLGGPTPPGKYPAGGAWGGSQRMVDQAVSMGRKHGLTLTSRKRPSNTVSGGKSDHWVACTQCDACDMANGVMTPQEMAYFKEVSSYFGAPGTLNSYGNTATVSGSNGQKYRVQILHGPGVDHADHVHVGIRVAGYQ